MHLNLVYWVSMHSNISFVYFSRLTQHFLGEIFFFKKVVVKCILYLVKPHNIRVAPIFHCPGLVTKQWLAKGRANVQQVHSLTTELINANASHGRL